MNKIIRNTLRTVLEVNQRQADLLMKSIEPLIESKKEDELSKKLRDMKKRTQGARLTKEQYEKTVRKYAEIYGTDALIDLLDDIIMKEKRPH